MNIVAISLYYKPIWPGFGTRAPQIIIDEAAKIGNNVIIYTGRIPSEMQIEKKDGMKNFSDNIGKGRIKINRLWTPDIKHEGLFKRNFAYSMFIIQCFFHVLFSKDVDLLMGLHPYPPFLISLFILARVKNVKTLLVQGDMWPDNLRELGIIKNSLLFSIISKLTIWAFNMTDVILVITHELKQCMAKYPIMQSKIDVLELATDTELFRPDMSAKDQFGNKFVVMYSGIFSPNYDFDIILNAAEKMRDTVLFVLAGGGELKDYLTTEIKKRNLENVLLEKPLKDITEVIRRLNTADVLVLGMKDNLEANTAHPSKIFEFMACGKPIICSTKGATRNLLIRSGAGIVIEPGDKEDFSRAIMNLYNSPEQRKNLGKNGLDYVRKYHSLDVFRKNLELILNKFN